MAAVVMMQTLEVLNAMVADGVIGTYAIGGAVAAYNYIEATATDDLDILVSFDGSEFSTQSGLVTLGPIVGYLAGKGYADWREEGIVIEGWPVQFLPVADDLDAEALDRAERIELEIDPSRGAVSTRVLTPEYVVATALRVGRPKDRVRITQFLEEDAVDLDALCGVLARHGLSQKWNELCTAAGIENPCVPGFKQP